MSPKSKWLITLMTLLALTACGNVDDDDDDSSSDDTDTTEETTDDTDTDDSDDVADDTDESTTGYLPDVDSFSLAVDDAVVVDAWDSISATATISVLLGDRFNTYVDDGTEVTFHAESGLLSSSYCTTVDGTCSVIWTSGGNKPSDGLTTITAYVVGEDSYWESGEWNGIYNVASDEVGDGVDGTKTLAFDETIISTSEAFMDYDFDGTYDADPVYVDGVIQVPEEAFLDYNGNGDYDDTSALFRGEYCSSAAVTAGHCADSSIYVWSNTQLVWSNLPLMMDITDNGDNTYTVEVTDSNGNYPPSGTTLSVSEYTDGVSIEGRITGTNPVDSVAVAYAEPHTFTYVLTSADSAGELEITVTSGDDSTTTWVTHGSI